MSDSKTLTWDHNPIRKPWSAQLLTSVGEFKGLLDQGQPDVFVPGYSGLAPEYQVKFWGELIVAIAWPESRWKPNCIYHEPPPLGVDSVGLLQLSYEDEKPYGLEPLDRAAKSLEDPLVNLRCGVKILAKLVSTNKVVEFTGQKKYGGASRYWSVMRAGEKHHLEEIRASVKDALGL